ncbi:MAG: TonB-dependent receptor, partial [Candidatus Hydrothermia bacterium]
MLFLLLIAQYPEYTTDTVRVLGTRLPPGFSCIMTSLWITDSYWISRAPSQPVDQAFTFMPGVHAVSRGLPGIQSDINVGPGNYTQTAVMVNGIRMEDPQTAHHNADLPLGLAEIERVELARGGASSLTGPGASSGAVNLVTGGPAEGVEAEAFAGLFSTGAGGLEIGNGAMGLGLSGARSDGYRPGSDYRVWKLSQKTKLGDIRAF